MADPTEDRERLLARIDPFREPIERNREELDRLLIERAECFRQIREADPKLPLSALADRAGVSVPAVIQQIGKAKARLTENPGGA